LRHPSYHPPQAVAFSQGQLSSALPPLDPHERRIFAHLDLDQFFVAVERLLDPRLRGVPVCVGGSDPTLRGAIACASYEARELGVHAGMALRRARVLCPNAVFVSGHFDDYLERSRAVLRVLEERTPRVLPRSIDEFAIDLTGCERLLGEPEALIRDLKRALLQETGLSCTVGLAGTPLVAKIASATAKKAAGSKLPGLAGLESAVSVGASSAEASWERGFLSVPLGHEAEFLAPLPLRALPGIGPKTEVRLRELGLQRLGDLARLDPEILRSALGAMGETLSQRARGGRPRLEVRRAVVPFVGQDDGAKDLLRDGLFGRPKEGTRQQQLPKSLSRERTFAEDQDDAQVLDAALVRLVEATVAGLRVQQLRGRSLALHVRYADLSTVSRHARVPKDAEEHQVLELARGLLSKLLERRLRIRRLGVGFLNLYSSVEQLSLFEGPKARSRRALGHALDRVRTRFGWESMRFGAGLSDAKTKEVSRGATAGGRADPSGASRPSEQRHPRGDESRRGSEAASRSPRARRSPDDTEWGRTLRAP